MKHVSDDENITFHFAQGYLDCPPPQWLAKALEGPPHLRFFSWDALILNFDYDAYTQKHGAVDVKKMLWGASDLDEEVKIPEDEEQAMKDFVSEYNKYPPEAWSVDVALEYLHNIIEDEGPFQGVIGISEGATVAATLLVEDIRRCRAQQTKSDFRCGLFYVGLPAWSAADGAARMVVEEEDGQVIDIPTCHIIGARDIFKAGAQLLLKICDADKALVVSDRGGHRIAQDELLNKQVADWIREQERAFVKER